MKTFRIFRGLRQFVVVILISGTLGSAAHALPPPERQEAATTKALDYGTYADTNDLLMFVTNRGWFAHDYGELLDRRAGLYYPRGSNRTVIHAAGLWMAAKFGKGARASVAEYDAEFAPGPVVNGAAPPDNPQFHVYRIGRGDTHESNSDYAEWPFEQGAPALQNHVGEDSLDWSGRRIPRLVGDQTLWCVFNDLDPGLRASDPGSLPPLGIEVRLLAWADQWPGSLSRTFFLHYTIINQSDSTLRDAQIGLWADPDIGDPRDDLAGSDSALSLAYCYNNGPDFVYGEAPPAVGIVVLAGPQVEAPGDSAWSMRTGRWIRDRQSLRMTGFSAWDSADDPRAETEVLYLAMGRDRKGFLQTDPTNNEPTSFFFCGDPVTQTGWLDQEPSDRRFVAGAGPVTIAPGDTQEVVAAVIVGQGVDATSAIASLRQAAQTAHSLNGRCFAPVESALADILPGLCPNIVSLRGPFDPAFIRPAAAAPRPEIMVALFGTHEFDAVSTDPNEVYLGGVKPSDWAVEDIGTPGVRETPCDCASTLRDGLPDLILSFDQSDIVEALQPVVEGAIRSLSLHAIGKDGSRAYGTDCLTLVDLEADPASTLRPTTSPRDDTKTLLALSNQPNPFNAATLISYRVTTDGPVHLAVFDILGRRVATLVDGWHAAGEYQVIWNGFDADGNPAGSGMYFYRLESIDGMLTRKMVLLK